jgi:hypothetical protein
MEPEVHYLVHRSLPDESVHALQPIFKIHFYIILSSMITALKQSVGVAT